MGNLMDINSKNQKLRIRINLKESQAIREIILDKGLSRLGDSYLNLLYSLALSEAEGKPTGVRVKDSILVKVAKATGIRSILPNRIQGGRVADSIEALIAYTWLKGLMKFDEMVNIFRNKYYDPTDSFKEIVNEAIKRLK